jgi:hypothetical protein
MFRLIKPSSGLFENIKNIPSSKYLLSSFLVVSIKTRRWLSQPKFVACFILFYILCMTDWRKYICNSKHSGDVSSQKQNIDCYQTWKFIAAFTIARHCWLSWPCLILCTHPQTLILVFHIYMLSPFYPSKEYEIEFVSLTNTDIYGKRTRQQLNFILSNGIQPA